MLGLNNYAKSITDDYKLITGMMIHAMHLLYGCV